MNECCKLVPFLTLCLVACGGAASDRGLPVAQSGFGAGAVPPSVPAGGGSVPGNTPGGGAGSGGPAADAGASGGRADAGGPGSADAGSADAGVADAGLAGGGGGGTDAGVSPPASCLAAPLLAQLGKSKLLVGADMTDAVAGSAPFDVRYLYLSGGLADGSGTCNSCATHCTAKGVSCANGGPGCVWWGCWQDDTQAPGKFVRDLIAKTRAAGQLPMISYYELLHTSGVAEGAAEVNALADPALMTRYFNDFRFVLQQLGSSPALLHVEPDLWGYAEQLNPNPHLLPAAVAKANAADCAGQEDSVAGFGRCLIAMVRKYAPSAKVGLHGSTWATQVDVTLNRDPATDVAAEGRKLADFLLACGAGSSDFIAIEASDRDAGYVRTQGRDTFWDPTNTTLPTFTQAFAWSQALTTRLQRPAIWWQVPLGNMSLPNLVNQWQDNRVDYFLSHPAEVARSNAFAVVFGAGDARQTTPASDGGNLASKVKRLAAAGGQPACF